MYYKLTAACASERLEDPSIFDKVIKLWNSGLFKEWRVGLVCVCVVDQRLLAVQPRHVWRLHVAGRPALHGVHIEPVRDQHRSLFRHYSPVSVRHQTHHEAHGRHDCCRLDPVGSHQYPTAVWLAPVSASSE